MNSKFYTALSASVAGIALVASQPALAQEAGSEDVAEDSTPENAIVVTGIRASLENSINLKRDNAAVVDAVSAEDVGKFPDNNVAESLQRITGVAIDRSGGCLLYTSPSPRDLSTSRMPSSA